MAHFSAEPRLSEALASLLPALRRHGRALTGSQTVGDELALTALRAVIDNPGPIRSASSLDVGLFQAFTRVWQQTDKPAVMAEEGPIAQAQTYLQVLPPVSRQALLLQSIENFTIPQIAEIISKTQFEVADLIMNARSEMQNTVRGSIMVIEDEAMIAMDLQDIVASMGHSVTGAAATLEQAITLAARQKPDLILSDIQLADGSSGIDAVDAILQAAGNIPVIFITAFPERLLTGKRREPAFVITKPYGEEQIQSAVGQAMFFRNSLPLTS